jgi:hypothetical protein
MQMMFLPHRKHLCPPLSVTEIALLFYNADNIRTSQDTQAFTACYGVSFTFLYVDDVHTSQETLMSSTTCYRDCFTSFLFCLFLFLSLRFAVYALEPISTSRFVSSFFYSLSFFCFIICTLQFYPYSCSNFCTKAYILFRKRYT